MLPKRYVSVRSAVPGWIGLLFCMLILLASGQARAGRPLPHTPLQVPPLTKNQAPPKATHPYPGTPVVSSVKPDFGPRHGWARVEITGERFEKGLNVLIGGKEAHSVAVNPHGQILLRFTAINIGVCRTVDDHGGVDPMYKGIDLCRICHVEFGEVDTVDFVKGRRP